MLQAEGRTSLKALPEMRSNFIYSGVVGAQSGIRRFVDEFSSYSGARLGKVSNVKAQFQFYSNCKLKPLMGIRRSWQTMIISQVGKLQ